MKRKWLAIGIILLFVGIAYSPVINASKVDGLFKIKQNVDDKLVQVNCYEFKYDGNVEKTTILLPKSEHLQMRTALSLTSSIDEKLEVYQNYGVLPSNVSIQKIKENYNQYLIAKKINVTAIQEYVSSHKTLSHLGIVMNNNCKIAAQVGGGININIGMSVITQWRNGIKSMVEGFWGLHLGKYWNSSDLSGFSLCILSGGLTSNGTLPDTSWDFLYSTLILLGFVGYYIEVLPLPIILLSGDYLGYTVSIMVVGVKK